MDQKVLVKQLWRFMLLQKFRNVEEQQLIFPNITPTFSRIWLMKTAIVLVLEIFPESLRKAWLINLACKPTCESPISPSIFDIMYGKGISQTGELIDMAADKDIIKKAGSWYSYGDDRIFTFCICQDVFCIMGCILCLSFPLIFTDTIASATSN